MYWERLRIPFNSRPHKEVDCFAVFRVFTPFSFQFTTSQGGRQMVQKYKNQGGSFNSRPHKEVDIFCFVLLASIFLSIHDLTRRSTCPAIEITHNLLSFNSRPHKEVDDFVSIITHSPLPFNSRPHKEVDNIFRSYLRQVCLSIHDLTRRSTGRSWGFYVSPDLSIHDLTRRSTSHLGKIENELSLSIHDLTRRSTKSAIVGSSKPFFQFTTSQGGRRFWYPY